MSNLLSKMGMLLYDWEKVGNGEYAWLQQLFDVLNPILYAIMAVVGAAGAIYAIILGVNLAKAEDTSKRDEAKKHLITVLIAVAVTIALVLFFIQLLPEIIGAFLPKTAE